MNTKTQKALKMAIEALSQDEGWFEPEAAIKACKEAIVSDVTDIDVGEIAQPVQEPVAVCKDSIVNWVNGKAIDGWLYTHPAPSWQECENLKHDLEGYMDANKELINREWQGLSDDERQEILEKIYEADGDTTYIDPEIAMIEAEQALKEKNHG